MTGIVVGADGSETSAAAVSFAADMARSRDMSLHIVHALDFAPYGFGGPYMDAGGVYEWVEEGGKTILADAAKLARSIAPDVEVTTDLSIGSGAQWLVDLSETARYIVLGASDSGAAATALLLGNTAVNVTSHAHCPVVVVRGDERESGPVVVGVDGSDLSDAAVAAAFAEASFRGATLLVVHVWSDLGPGLLEDPRASELVPDDLEQEETAVLAQALAGYQEQYPDVTVERRFYVDNPRARLEELSGEAQLIVVGSRGRGGFRGMLLGSTSNTLVGKSECPVMVVRPARD
nr:universal stress protein [Rhodococcus rhodnii]